MRYLLWDNTQETPYRFVGGYPTLDDAQRAADEAGLTDYYVIDAETDEVFKRDTTNLETTP